MRKVTMQDIADNLNLSKSVVSRALSDKYGVNEKTRAMVYSEAKRLGYLNTTKRVHTYNTILFFAPRSSLEDSSYGANVISGVEKELNRRGKRMELILLDKEMDSQQILAISDNVQGALILSSAPTQLFVHLSNSNLPIVLIDSMAQINKFDQVRANNYQGMYMGTEYILSKGHRQLVYVGDIRYSCSFLQRYHGCHDCIKHYNLYNPNDTAVCRFVLSSSENQDTSTFNEDDFIQILDKGYLPTAILCANDYTALHIYDLLYKKGLHIPDDISVLGFDDVEKCKWITPPLTSIHVPMAQLGQRAVERLIAKLDNPQAPREEIQLFLQLIERDSVKTIFRQ